MVLLDELDWIVDVVGELSTVLLVYGAVGGVELETIVKTVFIGTNWAFLGIIETVFLGQKRMVHEGSAKLVIQSWPVIFV